MWGVASAPSAQRGKINDAVKVKLFTRNSCVREAIITYQIAPYFRFAMAGQFLLQMMAATAQGTVNTMAAILGAATYPGVNSAGQPGMRRHQYRHRYQTPIEYTQFDWRFEDQTDNWIRTKCRLV
jgi:hypothetical protein